MKLNIRKLEESDWDTLIKWWAAWPNWTAPSKSFLPNNGTGGLMIEKDKKPIVAGFLYFTNSDAVLLEWIVSNPEYRKSDRKDAIELLINASEQLCKNEKKKYMFTIGRSKHLIETHKKLGWFIDKKPSYEHLKMGDNIGQIIGGYFGAANADKEMEALGNEKQAYKMAMQSAINNRQDIINPYAGITDMSGLVRDLSSQITNPFNNLQVSTAAAELQAEEADITFANTLDTMEAIGAGAAGATAIAQAALKSKKGVAATIEKQEAANAELRAKGEQQMQKDRVKAMESYDEAVIKLKTREENAEAQGEIFQFNIQETRTNADINRYTAMYLGFQAAENEARTAKAEAQTDMWEGVSGLFGSDRRLKNNIKLIGYSPSGLKIYTFEYINKLFGEGIYQGVMSDEIPSIAVIKHQDGWDRVDYSKIDVNFKKIN